MYLKSLKLAGFKSFVDPTSIAIRSHMNAIVGPNGCGKSNIVDAIRWVVGESSAKQLRGQAMSDVIFNGTTQRKAVGRAMVELNFDNSDGRIGGEYAQYTDLAIRREVERDGQSSYFLNGTQCRRRDILDVFLGTGLGPRSYSIIEQGMISQLIEAKPEELRHHLEEVAGISKYRERRRETENRMRHTQDNLDRLNDIREELIKQLRHLKRQANAAESYKVLKAEEREYNLQMKALNWQSLETRHQSQQQKINQQMTALEQKVAQQREDETRITQLGVELETYSEQHQTVQKRYYQLGETIARVEQQIQHHQQQLQGWQTELDETENLWQELEQIIFDNKTQIETLTEEIAQLEPEKDNINARVSEANNNLLQAEQAMQNWQSCRDESQQQLSQVSRQIDVTGTKSEHQTQQINQNRLRQQNLQQQLDDLPLDTTRAALLPQQETVQNLQARLQDLSQELQQQQQQINDGRLAFKAQQGEIQQRQQALQTLEKESAQLSALQQAALGAHDEQSQQWLQQRELQDYPRLAQKLKVNNGWEKAVEMVLGSYFDAVCVADMTSYLGDLAALDKGQVMLVEESTGGNQAATLASQVSGSCAGSAWLNNVYLAENLQQAQQLRVNLDDHQSVITREGVWMAKHWVRVSNLDNAQSGVIEREQQLAILSRKIEAATQELEVLFEKQKVAEQTLSDQEVSREQMQQRYQHVSEELSQAKAELNRQSMQLDHLSQEQIRLQTEIADLTYAIESSEQQVAQFAETLLELQQQREQLTSKCDELNAQRDQHQTTLQDYRSKAQAQRQRADEYAIRLSANENQLNLLQQTIERDQRQFSQLAEKRDFLQTNLSADDSPLESLQQDLQAKLADRLTIEHELKAAEQTVEQTKTQLKSIEVERQKTLEQIDTIKSQLDSWRLSSQEFTVRQQTIIEQMEADNAVLQEVIDGLPEEAEIKLWQEKLDTLAKRIQRLGPINLAAIDEYQTSEERKIYLDQQFDDLTEALNTLEAAIRKIDKESKARFKETFDQVNSGFERIFPQVFGGGRATLELSEDDLLTTGILVKAQPPGKRNSSIHMLSGGEKALTAISLIFAMFQLNPAPFCILDEVDAPLDDLNVARFCRLVKEMSSQTQFLIISHNKSTIEKADHLMGVTMQEPGVSRLVAVDMQEALEMVEA